MKDPTKVPVQYNIMIPWDFREFIRAKSERDGVSQNQLGVDALMKAYGREFASDQATPAP